MYEELQDGTILRKPDMTYIPPISDNADYVRYLEWLSQQPEKEQ